MRQIYASLKQVSIDQVSPVQLISSKEYYGEGYEDSLRRIPSIEKAKRLLGYVPNEALDVTLQETLSWFIEHYRLAL
ncbi:MAG TPA: epimerase, partial [Fibrobacteraceae bacterium]|jgi:UDP-apiose/xylose synthase|nr:epimerase [Fibrobacteraceae bacterium]